MIHFDDEEEFDRDDLRAGHHQGSKGRKGVPLSYDRPGRLDAAERRYRKGSEHLGKGGTLRNKRRPTNKRRWLDET